MTDAASDDQAFAEYGASLVDAIDIAIEPWVAKAIAARARAFAAGTDDDARASLGVAVRAAAIPELRALVALDLDDQRSTPLEILRAAATRVSDELRTAGVEPIADGGAAPGDPYGIGPMAFADLGPDVADAGLRWGAAKAHVHLQRRRT